MSRKPSKHDYLNRYAPQDSHGKSWFIKVCLPILTILVAVTSITIVQRASEYDDRSKECNAQLSNVDQKVRALGRIKADDPSRDDKVTIANDEFETADNDARSSCPMTEREYITILDYTTYKVSADHAKKCARGIPSVETRCADDDFNQALGTVSACAQSMAIDAATVKDWSTFKRWGQVVARWANSDSEIDSEAYTPTTIPDPCGIKDRNAPWPQPRYN